MSESVVILGAGPAGLMAAHAVARAGLEPVILSRKQPSWLYGAMYLHRPIPGITFDEPDMKIHCIKVGTRDEYAQKVYGDRSHPVSWDQFPEGELPAWNLTRAYAELWDEYESHIHETEVTQEMIRGILGHFNFVYSTLDRRTICQKPEEHIFNGQQIWVQHGPSSDKFDTGNIMYYSAAPHPLGFDWYRFSRINMYSSWEYASDPGDVAWGDQKLSTGIKPTTTNCDCWPGLRYIGRFGRWEKGVLTHHAFEIVEKDMRDAV